MTPEQRAEAREYDRLHSSGAELIRGERARQRFVEGWTPEHDDRHWRDEMASAAACYAMPDDSRLMRGAFGAPIPADWPWDAEWWKPTPNDRIRELVKAGALIAAEIERLQRAELASKAEEES